MFCIFAATIPFDDQ